MESELTLQTVEGALVKVSPDTGALKVRRIANQKGRLIRGVPHARGARAGAYQFRSEDAGTVVESDHVTTHNFTIPAGEAFPEKSHIVVLQLGEGAVTVVAEAGVELNGVDGGSMASAGQFKYIDLYQYALGKWAATGGLAE